MAKLNLSGVSNLLGNPVSAQNTINGNNERIEQAFENTLSRDGTTPNQMEADLDLNNNDIINVKTVETSSLILNGKVVVPSTNLGELPEEVMISPVYDPTGVKNDAFDLANMRGELDGDQIDRGIWTDQVARYRKKVHLNLPVRGPNYETILSNEGLSFLIPQSFTVDWTDNLMYINCSGDVATGHLWVRVHNFSTGEYVTTFSTPMALTQNYSEGIVVRREGGLRKLYMQTAPDVIGRFDITTLPDDMSNILSEATYTVGVHSQFDFRNNKFLVQQRGPTLGADTRRNNFAIYDSTLSTRLGTLLLGNDDAGPWTSSSLADYIPKIQTMQIGDGVYFASCGGFHSVGSTSIPYSYQGIKIFNSDGSLITENLIDPEPMSAVLNSNGIFCDKVEYEGAVMSPDGRIYSLCLTVSNGSSNAPFRGITIFEEYAQGEGSIDFFTCARVYPKIKTEAFTSGVWPRSQNGKIHNPWTGAELTNWEQICDMLRSMDIPRFAYYSTATVGVLGIGSEVIPGGTYVEFLSHDNQSWTVNLYGSGWTRLYRVFGTPGSRSVIRRIIPMNGQRGVTAAEVQAVGGLTVSITDGNYFDVATQSADGILRIDPTNSLTGQVIKIKRRGGAFNLVIQNGSGTTITTLTANQNAELMMGSTQYYLWQ